MRVLEILPLIHGILYVSLQSALLTGLFLERRRETGGLGKAGNPSGTSSGALPRVSVVVPVHNEESRLPALLEDLAAQDYDGLEIVLVDDRSSDGTAGLLSGFAGGRDNVRVVCLKENPGPNHKQYALERGLAVAAGDLLLFTDADCRIGPAWAGAMAARMGDPRVGATIGPVFKSWPGGQDRLSFGSAVLPPEKAGGFLYSYQCYDHVVRFVYLAGAVGLGAAGGGFGNNLILRRAALEAAGGYAAVPPSPTEDAALISLIRSSTDYRIRAVYGARTHVYTKPETSWKALINQTLRWNNGGLFSPEIVTRINYTILMLTITVCTLALFLMPLYPKLWPMPLAQFIVMLENTLGAVCIARGGRWKGRGTETRSSLPPLFWLRELLVMPFYMTLMTVLGFLGVKTTWKETTMGPRA
ncbi:MAG: glycosyltransferase [Treponema sp.]|jgi:cellulose synthase/poly-beta-1,6-N-acetylglucosamine synthase-like glycosyltransferase|nr:glycosyltransferase [Treponema sp.]